METLVISSIKRKAFISVIYLLIGALFMFAYLHFWYFHEFEYARNALSPISLLDDVINPFPGPKITLIGTAVIYFVHFFFGSIYYPAKYLRSIEMRMNLSDLMDPGGYDFSGSRGLLICLFWAGMFYLAFGSFLPTITLVLVLAFWILIHIVLLVLTSTHHSFTEFKETVDLTLIMPEKYPAEYGKHVFTDLYFYIPEPTGDHGNQIPESILKGLEKIITEEKQKQSKIKGLSERLAKC